MAGVTNPPYEIESIKNENYEYLTFLTTYIIPLICIDLTKIRYVFVPGVLLVLIGIYLYQNGLILMESYPWHLWDIDCIAQRLKAWMLPMELC